MGRSIKTPLSDGDASLELPTSAARASRYLSFDSNGVPEAGETVVDVAAVAANSTNINALAAIDNEITSLAAIEADISANAAIEDDISFNAANMTAITAAANIITMSSAYIELTVSNATEVAGSNYNSFADALAYALPLLQAGGTLKFIVPVSTTIAAQQDLTFPTDGSVGHFILEGGAEATSILTDVTLDFAQDLYMRVTMSDITVRATGFRKPLDVNYISFLELENVTLEAASTAAMTVEGVSTLLCTGCTFSSTARGGVVLTRVNSAKFSDTTFAELGAARDGLKVQEQTTVYIGTSISFASTNTYATAFLAEDNSTILIKSITPTFDGNETTQYDPAVDTFDNHYSRIITTL